MRVVFVVALTACSSGTMRGGSAIALRASCAEGQRWNGSACVRWGDAPAKLDAGWKAVVAQDPDAIKAAVEAAAKEAPLDHASNVRLWEQRGIGLAYGDDEPNAVQAFGRMLAIDPAHILSYDLSQKATLAFENARKAVSRPPELDINWGRGQRVGDPVPLDIEVLADPLKFLHRATIFVRTRGETTWRAADLELAGPGDRRVVLPPVAAAKPVSLELYASAYDADGNEVLTWADATRPREIALRYDPPTPWYKKWWVITAAVGVVAVATGVTVYELTLAPPSTIGGDVMVK